MWDILHVFYIQCQFCICWTAAKYTAGTTDDFERKFFYDIEYSQIFCVYCTRKIVINVHNNQKIRSYLTKVG